MTETRNDRQPKTNIAPLFQSGAINRGNFKLLFESNYKYTFFSLSEVKK